MSSASLLSRILGRRRGVVTVLRLNGVIGRAGALRGAALNLETLERTIMRAFVPGRLKAVALSVNSPGGSPVQSTLLARRIRQLADGRQVPVIAFAEDAAVSGGYWLACAADEIYAEESSILGSIGVVAAGFGFPEFLARHGIERRVHTAGARKAMLDPFRPEVEEDLTRLKAIHDDIHDSFKELVRTRRAGKLKCAEDDIFTGEVWSGREALALGLIDGIGDVRTVMRERFGGDVRIRPITVRRPLLRQRLGMAAMSGGAAEAAAGMLDAFEEWSMWKRFGL